MTTLPPAPHRGGLFYGLQAVQRGRLCPYIPRAHSAACRPSRGLQAAIFASMASRAGERPKRKTAVKAIYRPYTAFYTLVAIPIFPHRKTARGSRQRPAQSIKQPRPAPPGRKPGCFHLFRAMDSTAQRFLPASHQAQASLSQTFTCHTATSCLNGQNLFPSAVIVVSPPESRWHSRFIVSDP